MLLGALCFHSLSFLLFFLSLLQSTGGVRWGGDGSGGRVGVGMGVRAQSDPGKDILEDT